MLCRANSAAAQQSRSFTHRAVFKAVTVRRSVAVHAGMLDNMLKKVVGQVSSGHHKGACCLADKRKRRGLVPHCQISLDMVLCKCNGPLAQQSEQLLQPPARYLGGVVQHF
jgi:hypothetical protein